MSDDLELQIIPPLSVVIVVAGSPGWRDQNGAVFRIGYYQRNDGLDCVWLVDDDGGYSQTTDQEDIRKSFAILQMSDEKDLFEAERPIIGPRPIPEV
jgi:hypothetical protein